MSSSLKHITVASSTKHLKEVRSFIQSYLLEEGFGEREVSEIILAVDEAYTNIIKHAYENNSSHKVLIAIGSTPTQLWIELTDHGKHFDPAAYQAPDLMKRIKNKQRGGMGVYLIRKLMDVVEYTSTREKNTLLMKKNR
jgi:serine/threonine-protein kinase RsbW